MADRKNRHIDIQKDRGPQPKQGNIVRVMEDDLRSRLANNVLRQDDKSSEQGGENEKNFNDKGR